MGKSTGALRLKAVTVGDIVLDYLVDVAAERVLRYPRPPNWTKSRTFTLRFVLDM